MPCIEVLFVLHAGKHFIAECCFATLSIAWWRGIQSVELCVTDLGAAVEAVALFRVEATEKAVVLCMGSSRMD